MSIVARRSRLWGGGIALLLIAAGLAGCGGSARDTTTYPSATVSQTFTPVTPATASDAGSAAVKPSSVAADGSNAGQYGKLDPQILSGAPGTVLTMDAGAGIAVSATTPTGAAVPLQHDTLQLSVDPLTGALRTNAAALLPPGNVTLRLVNGKLSVEDGTSFLTSTRSIQTPLSIQNLALHFTVRNAGVDGQGQTLFNVTLPQTLEWQFERADGKYLLKDSFVRLDYGDTFVTPNLPPVINITLYDGANTLMTLSKTAQLTAPGVYEFRAASNMTEFTGVAIDLNMQDDL